MNGWVQFLEDNPQVTLDEILNRTEAPALQVIGTADLEPEIERLYLHGREPGFSTGWAKIDELYRIAPGYWTLVTGWPNMGKSSWVDNLAVQTMMRHDWRWLFFSAENQPYATHWAGLAELYTGAPFNPGYGRMSAETKERAKAFLGAHCWHIQPDDVLSVSRIVAVARDAIKQHSINCVVIDPWNELDHSRPHGVSETEYVSHALSQIRTLARSSKVHVFVVAHPTKLGRDRDGQLPVPTPHDCAGSSNFWNKSDYAICVWRDFTDKTGENWVYVQKARHRWVAKLGKAALYYDLKVGRYLEQPIDGRYSRREPGDENE